jgi:hypothetical protein
MFILLDFFEGGQHGQHSHTGVAGAPLTTFAEAAENCRKENG